MDQTSEELLCALIYLLTRQSSEQNAKLAPAIEHHLNRLVKHPEIASLPVLRKTCSRLILHWRTKNTGMSPSPTPVNFH